MSQGRLENVEQKVDKVYLELSEVKSKVANIEGKLDTHMSYIEQHVAGDTKIIREIQPLIEKLPYIAKVVEDYRYNEMAKEKKKEDLMIAAKKVCMATSIVGVIATIIGFLV